MNLSLSSQNVEVTKVQQEPEDEPVTSRFVAQEGCGQANDSLQFLGDTLRIARHQGHISAVAMRYYEVS
jgi:hypothetical protein